MNDFSYLLQNFSKEEILKNLQKKLEESDESDFWKEKIIPYVNTVLSILLPLKEQKLLFNPELNKYEKLDSALYFRWSDLVCLKLLYFIIKESNKQNKITRIKFENQTYTNIDIETLENYLLQNRINIIDEDSLDFPISTYNVHNGLNSIIKKLFN